MGNLLKDIAYALRSLRKNPAFFVTAVLTIALGLGASAAIFSVVNAVLLRPLPYPDADRLVHIWPDLRNRNVVDFASPPGDLYDLRLQTTAFEGLAGFNFGGRAPVSVQEGAEAELIPTLGVTSNFFRVIGAHVVRGRDFVDDDEARQPPSPPGTPSNAIAPVPARVILGYEFWQRKFGGRDDVLNTHITLGNGRALVVGVLEPGFELLLPPDVTHERTPSLFVALRPDYHGGNRANVSLRTLGRLKPGMSKENAQSEVDTVAADLRKRFASKESAGLHFRVEDMYEDLVADVKLAILVLMGAVVFVLLIACANVANLLLVRSAARQRELAVRAALGGSRGRLVRQLLTESIVLSAAGVILGLVIADAAIEALKRVGPVTLPRLQTVTIDPMVVMFAAAAGFAAAAIFGILPAWRASRPDVMDVLRTGSRSAGVSGGRVIRSAVVVAEVALSLVLLVGAGLMMRSFVALTQIDPGYNPRGVLTFQMSNIRAQGPEGRAAFIRSVRERLQGISGVQAVTAVSPLPLDGGTSSGRWGTEEALTNPSAFHQSTMHFVLPGYFQAIGGRLIEGRTFTDDDNREDRHVIVVDDLVAKMAFPGQSAVGKRILSRIRTDEPLWYEIIGVVAHQRHLSLAGNTREAIFFADGYMGHGAAGRWAVRTGGDPNSLAPQVREEIRKLDPRVIVSEMQPMTDFLNKAMAPTQFALFLVGVFSVVAVILAGIGLYGVLSTTVRQRTSEIGVRMAFGAQTSSIFQLVLGQGMKLSAVGLVVGLAIAAGTTQVMRSMLVGVEPTDPATFASIAVVFAGVAALACWLPARRASRLNPIVALRDE